MFLDKMGKFLEQPDKNAGGLTSIPGRWEELLHPWMGGNPLQVTPLPPLVAFSIVRLPGIYMQLRKKKKTHQQTQLAFLAVHLENFPMSLFASEI